MSKIGVTGITVSAEFGFEQEYGKGTKSFASIQGRYPDAGIPSEELVDVVIDGLDIYFAAWRTLLAGRFATGIITSDEFKETLEKVSLRIDKTMKYLRNHDGPAEQQ